MERKDGAKNEETMRIRMSADLLKRIQDAKAPSGWGEEADSSFARYLIIIGLQEAEHVINKKETRYNAEIEQEAGMLPKSELPPMIEIERQVAAKIAAKEKTGTE